MDKIVLTPEHELETMIERVIRKVMQEQPSAETKVMAKPATKKEASDYLGISLPTLDQLIKSGELKAFNIGSLVRVHWADVEAYVNKKRG